MSDQKHQKFVVKFNATTELFMREYQPLKENCLWVMSEPFMEFDTLGQANLIAESINKGGVGVPKPS
jgi:hypothetical protein